MERQKLQKPIILLMFVLFVADLLAKKFYWYLSIWWFDVLMHFSAGFWVGLFFLYIFTAKEFILPVVKVLLCVFVVGFLWELYEFYIYQHLMGIPFDFLDTLSDLFLDLLGGTLAIFYFFKKSPPIPPL
jgi:hypothetical protein